MTAARSLSALTCPNILDNGHPAGNAADGPAISAEVIMAPSRAWILLP